MKRHFALTTSENLLAAMPASLSPSRSLRHAARDQDITEALTTPKAAQPVERSEYSPAKLARERRRQRAVSKGLLTVESLYGTEV
jgi:hypothetical protein